MDFRNILDSTRQYFQGLPSQSPSVIPPPITSPNKSSKDPNLTPLHSLQSSQKFEEGLGATLSQMYSIGRTNSNNLIATSILSPNNINSASVGTKNINLNLARPSVLNSAGNPPSSHSPSIRDRERERDRDRDRPPIITKTLSSSGSPNISSKSENDKIIPPSPTSARKTNVNNTGNGTGTTMVEVLDLSVKTVKQSADSSTMVSGENRTGSGSSTPNNSIININNNSSSSVGGTNIAIANSTTGAGGSISSGTSSHHHHHKQSPGPNNIIQQQQQSRPSSRTIGQDIGHSNSPHSHSNKLLENKVDRPASVISNFNQQQQQQQHGQSFQQQQSAALQHQQHYQHHNQIFGHQYPPPPQTQTAQNDSRNSPSSRSLYSHHYPINIPSGISQQQQQQQYHNQVGSQSHRNQTNQNSNSTSTNVSNGLKNNATSNSNSSSSTPNTSTRERERDREREVTSNSNNNNSNSSPIITSHHHNLQNQRPSSVIPPYNPLTPTIGIPPYPPTAASQLPYQIPNNLTEGYPYYHPLYQQQQNQQQISSSTKTQQSYYPSYTPNPQNFGPPPTSISSTSSLHQQSQSKTSSNSTKSTKSSSNNASTAAPHATANATIPHNQQQSSAYLPQSHSIQNHHQQLHELHQQQHNKHSSLSQPQQQQYPPNPLLSYPHYQSPYYHHNQNISQSSIAIAHTQQQQQQQPIGPKVVQVQQSVAPRPRSPQIPIPNQQQQQPQQPQYHQQSTGLHLQQQQEQQQNKPSNQTSTPVPNTHPHAPIPQNHQQHQHQQIPLHQTHHYAQHIAAQNIYNRHNIYPQSVAYPQYQTSAGLTYPTYSPYSAYPQQTTQNYPSAIPQASQQQQQPTVLKQPTISHQPYQQHQQHPHQTQQIQQQPQQHHHQQQQQPQQKFAENVHHHSTTPPTQSHLVIPTAASHEKPIISIPNMQKPTQKQSTNKDKVPGQKSPKKSDGSSRKNVLNVKEMLRNSVENRIQEKEKFNNNQKTWNFHGKKYTMTTPNPVQIAHQHLGSPVKIEMGNNSSLVDGNKSTEELQKLSINNATSGGQNSLHSKNESEVNRIKTKAEKKQLFPNLFSQMEQENKNSEANGGNASVFDFRDDDSDIVISKKTLGEKPLSRRNSTSPTKGLMASQLQVPQVPSTSTSQQSSDIINKIEIPSSSTGGVAQVLDPNEDDFWALCDSFVDELAANPSACRSRRGGLWTKLKPKKSEKTVTTLNKVRRVKNPSEEDSDFDIEEVTKVEEEEEEEVDDGEKKKKDLSESTDDEEELDEEEDDEEEEESLSSDEIIPSSKKKSLNKSPKGSARGGRKNRKTSQSKSPATSTRRRLSATASLRNGKKLNKKIHSLSDLDDEDSTSRTSIGSTETDFDSDLDSDDSSNSNSDDSSSTDSDESTDDGTFSSDSQPRKKKGSAPIAKRKLRPTRSSSLRGGSTRGEISDKKTRKNTRSSSKKMKSKEQKRNDKKNKDKGRTSGRSTSARRALKTRSQEKGGKDNASSKRKLRPKRNCSKGKLKDISGESGDEVRDDGEERSSDEEWIMRDELGKKKKKIVFGDGSDFKPGWEEDLIDFKKKLRMPTSLIRVSKPSSLQEGSISTTPTKSKRESTSPSKIDKDEPSLSSSKSAKENKSPAGPSKKRAKNESPSLLSPSSGLEEGEIRVSKKFKSQISTSEKDKKSGTKSKKSTEEKGKSADLDSKDSKLTKGGKKKLDMKSIAGPASKKAKLNAAASKTEVEELSDSTTEEGILNTLSASNKKNTEVQLLPTPGLAQGQTKFNKKMSIKSVFGVDLPKKTLRRNKFKSGFDYIRKKKKIILGADGNAVPPMPKRVKLIADNMSLEDIQAEIRGWVLNKGLGETILHRASRLGYPDVAAYCLENEMCSPNGKDNAGYTPLHNCAIKGNLEVAKVLLVYGASPSQAAPGGIRPLHEACENGHTELVRLLISYGADPLLATYAGQSPIELAENHKEVKLFLEEHIKDIQGSSETSWKFKGCGLIENDTGFDVTADPPKFESGDSYEIDFIDGFEFEASDTTLPPLYRLKGESSFYVLLQDLIIYIGQPKDRFLRHNPTAEIVELNSNDFLEQAQCCHLLGEKFNLNSSSDLLTLIKYDDRIKKMLNIDSSTIT